MEEMSLQNTHPFRNVTNTFLVATSVWIPLLSNSSQIKIVAKLTIVYMSYSQIDFGMENVMIALFTETPNPIF